MTVKDGKVAETPRESDLARNVKDLKGALVKMRIYFFDDPFIEILVDSWERQVKEFEKDPKEFTVKLQKQMRELEVS